MQNKIRRILRSYLQDKYCSVLRARYDMPLRINSKMICKDDLAKAFKIEHLQHII